jgi:hypothetical protein
MLNFMRIRQAFLVLCSLLFAAPLWSRVLLRWTESEAPSAKRLGVNELVIPWDADRISAFKKAAQQGYEIFAEVSPEQASEAAAAIAKNGLCGIILNPGGASQVQANEALRGLRSAYPKLVIRVLNSNGKQPQLKSRLVINRNGILQVTSSTAQPWIDTNLALVKLERAFRPDQIPLYSFQWDSEKNEQLPAPTGEDYALAVAEAGAFDADVVLRPPAELQKELAQNNPEAWEIWDEVKRYLAFVSRVEHRPEPSSNVGVVADNSGASYEPINLLARHNILFRVLSSSDLSGPNLEHIDVVIVFVTPGEQMIRTIADFATNGGTAVLVDAHGLYPWQSIQPVRNAQNSASYALGKGRVIELSEPVSDPETLAQDVRRLIDNQKMQISLWNALTTVAVLYRSGEREKRMVELLNYAEEPLRVQVRIKGSFSTVRYETPEYGCCEPLKPTQHDGFTEFVVPSLQIAGRVHLRPERPHAADQR